MKPPKIVLWVILSTYQVVQILVHLHFDLVSLLLVQLATRRLAQMATQKII